MRIRSSFISIVATLALCSAALGVDKKDELYQKAKAAEDAQNADEAARYYCEVAAMDVSYRDAKSMCNVLTEESKRLRTHSDQRFDDGVAMFQRGALEDAERAFKNVVSGPHVAEAQQYLGKIKTAKQAATAAAFTAEQAANANFERGSQAFQQNDFLSARNYLKQVTGKYAGEATLLLQQMSRYDQDISNGDSAAEAGNLQSALNSYQDAAAIKRDGPGSPMSKSAQLEVTIAARQKPAGTMTVPHVPQGEGGLNLKSVDATLEEAAAARSRGDLKLAKEKYQEVIVAEPSNMKAIRALASIDGGRKPAGGADPIKAAAAAHAEALLATGLREFYAGNYESSEIRLQDYLNTDGSKKALAQFFLGASKITRYYLNGAQSGDHKLLTEAQIDFRLAAETPKFSPPSTDYVSPLILEAYSDSTK